MRRHEDWLRQARKDLGHAESALKGGDYEWACFAAQQSAEKAVKSLLHARGITVFGHAVTFLVTELPPDDKPSEALLDSARELDTHYITSRYPDAHPAGAPLDYYTRGTAERAVEAARGMVEHVEDRFSHI